MLVNLIAHPIFNSKHHHMIHNKKRREKLMNMGFEYIENVRRFDYTKDA